MTYYQIPTHGIRSGDVIVIDKVPGTEPGTNETHATVTDVHYDDGHAIIEARTLSSRRMIVTTPGALVTLVDYT